MNIPIIRASERVAFERCGAKWWWAWREGLVPKSEDAGPLWFGTGVHIALAKWYCGPGTKRGPEPAETWEEFARDSLAYVKTNSDLDDASLERYEDAAELGRTMLEGYRARYGRDEHMFIVRPESTFSLMIPWPDQSLYEVETGAILAEHAGTYDLVWQDLNDGGMYLEEHKTAASIQTGHLALDNQGGTYWATATGQLQKEGVLGPKQFLRGIEYNFLRKAKPDERPRDPDGYATNKPTKADYIAALRSRGYQGADIDKGTLAKLEEIARSLNLIVLGERSKVQPPALFERVMVHRTSRERRAQLLRIQQQALQMQLFRDGTLPVTKNPAWDCRRCQFYAMCELQERGGNWEDFRAMTYDVRDPYADHRKSASE